MNKTEEIKAIFKMSLNSNKGKRMSHTCIINQWQGEAIAVIIEKKNFTEQDLVKITNELE